MSVFLFFLLPLSAVLSTSACLFLHFVLPCLHFCPASRLSVCLFFSSLLTLTTSLVFLSAAAAFFLYVRHQVKPHTPTCTTPPVSRDPFVTRASVSIPILLSGVRRSWPSLLLHIALRAELHNGSTLARLHTRLHVHTHTKTSTDMHSCAGALKVATTTGRCTCTHWSRAVLVNEK